MSDEIVAQTISDIPDAAASNKALGDFAITFDAYRYWGDISKIREVAESAEDSIIAWRTRLFFAQRKHYWGSNPFGPNDASADERYEQLLRQGVERLRVLLANS